jgi:hypothetical protein
MVEIGSAGPTLAVISVTTTITVAAQALAPVWPTMPLQLRSIPPLRLRVTLLGILLVRMEVMMEPLAVILVEGAVMVLRLEVILVLEMVATPIMELGEMPMVGVILRTEMGRIMVIKLRAVTAMAEVMLLLVGMVEMLLLVITLVGMLLLEVTPGITGETPTEVMEEMPTVVMAAMGTEMEGMAEGTVTVTVTPEMQMTKPMITKS